MQKLLPTAGTMVLSAPTVNDMLLHIPLHHTRTVHALLPLGYRTALLQMSQHTNLDFNMAARTNLNHLVLLLDAHPNVLNLNVDCPLLFRNTIIKFNQKILMKLLNQTRIRSVKGG